MEYGLNDFSFSFWVKDKSTGYVDGIIYENSDLLTVSRHLISNHIRVTIREESYLINDVFDNTWRYITIVRYDIKNMDFYVDGKL